MAAYRSGYGLGLYDTELYGLDGSIIDGISIIASVATTVSSAQAVYQSGATSAASAAGSCSGEIIYQASASGTATATNAASGEIIYLGSASASASASGSADGQFVTNGEASTSVASSTSAAGVRVQESSASVSAESGASEPFGIIWFTASPTVNAQLRVQTAPVRVRFGIGATSVTSVTAVIGREKWEVIPVTPINWNLAA